MYLNVDYKATVIKIRHAVLKIFEQLYKIFEQLFQILATLEQLFGIFLSNFLPFSEQNLDAPIHDQEPLQCNGLINIIQVAQLIRSKHLHKYSGGAPLKMFRSRYAANQ